MLNIKSQDTLNHAGLARLYIDSMSIGARLRQLRTQFGLNQETIGEYCEVSKGMVSQWESDLVTPPTDRLIKLRDKLEFSFDWLLTGEIADYKMRMKPPLKELFSVAEKLPDTAISKLAREGVSYTELIEDAKKPKQNGA